jgi:hypothetical protein
MKDMKKNGFYLLKNLNEMRISQWFPRVENPLFFMSFMASW